MRQCLRYFDVFGMGQVRNRKVVRGLSSSFLVEILWMIKFEVDNAVSVGLEMLIGCRYNCSYK